MQDRSEFLSLRFSTNGKAIEEWKSGLVVTRRNKLIAVLSWLPHQCEAIFFNSTAVSSSVEGISGHSCPAYLTGLL